MNQDEYAKRLEALDAEERKALQDAELFDDRAASNGRLGSIREDYRFRREKLAKELVPTVGSTWRHRNGNLYRVMAIANEPNEDRYPRTVIYQGLANGALWARPASDWARSFTLAASEEVAS